MENISKEALKGLKGHIRIELIGPDGVVKDVRDIDNLIVASGKNTLAAWIAAASQAGYFMPYIGIGIGATAAATGNTGLVSETGSRMGVGAGISNPGAPSAIWQNVQTFAAGNPATAAAITEAGLFDATVTGNMFARQVFSVINKGTGDTLQITWQVTIG